MIRVLLIGCGDIALRTADLLRGKVRLYGLTRRRDDIPKLRGRGIVPIIGDLDRFHSLERLRTAPFAVLHFAPPPAEGRADPRTASLVAALTSADYTAALRLHQHDRRLWRLRRRASQRNASAQAADTASKEGARG